MFGLMCMYVQVKCPCACVFFCFYGVYFCVVIMSVWLLCLYNLYVWFLCLHVLFYVCMMFMSVVVRLYGFPICVRVMSV